MNARGVVLVLAAIVMAGTAVLFARIWLAGERAQVPLQVAAPAAPALSVLVAKSDLPTGLFLKEEHLRWQAWPSETFDPGYLVENTHDLSTLVGAVVRSSIAAGQPITEGRVVRPGDRGFLAAVLKPGMRAVSVALTPTTGISGLVFPGDRVDMVLTQSLPIDENESSYAHRSSETVLENVRILAIDQSMQDQAEDAAPAQTATIEVTPKQVEAVAVAAELGRLSLSLRSLGRAELEAADPVRMAVNRQQIVGDTTSIGQPARADDKNAEPHRGRTYTLDSDVSHLLDAEKTGGNGPVILVMRGSIVEEVTLD
ncbi:MAG: Flp pilus assembly protein CpaB [Dongiaceae bacterium]